MVITAKDSRNPHLPESADELLRKAIRLGLELEALLEVHAVEGFFQFRLARAHTLSAIDVLTSLAVRHSRVPVVEPVPISGIYPAPVVSIPAREERLRQAVLR